MSPQGVNLERRQRGAVPCRRTDVFEWVSWKRGWWLLPSRARPSQHVPNPAGGSLGAIMQKRTWGKTKLNDLHLAAQPTTGCGARPFKLGTEGLGRQPLFQLGASRCPRPCAAAQAGRGSTAGQQLFFKGSPVYRRGHLCSHD